MPGLGGTTGEHFAATFGAPFVEETLKGVVLIGLLRRRRGEFDGPTDGIIYAAMTGLGFAIIENVGYYTNALVTPERGGIALLGYAFVLRGLLSPLLHAIFTSMTGLGVAYSASRPHGARWVALGLLAAAVLLGTWNGLSLYGAAGIVAGYLIMASVLAALIAVLVVGRRSVLRLIGVHLLPYQDTGLVTFDDIAMLSSLRARGAARAWARKAGGLPAARAMSLYQFDATELALDHSKAHLGILDSETFAKREYSLLVRMAVDRHDVIRSLRGGAKFTPVPWASSASVFQSARHPD